MKRILLMGPPGVGKGTFGRLQVPIRLSQSLSLPLISLGDEIRASLARGLHTKVNQDANTLVEQGHLINDSMAWSILQQCLPSTGFLLDGFPRTPSQLTMMQAYSFEFDLMISLKQCQQVILSKLLGRRVCSECGNTYNLNSVKSGDKILPPILPKTPGVCDDCSSPLVIRPDDSPEIIHRRFSEYKNKTEPLQAYFQGLGKLLEFDAKGGVKDFPKLLEQVSEKMISAGSQAFETRFN